MLWPYRVFALGAQDLSGLDVARKALIIARMQGWDVELEDITHEPLVGWGGPSNHIVPVDEWLAGLERVRSGGEHGECNPLQCALTAFVPSLLGSLCLSLSLCLSVSLSLQEDERWAQRVAAAEAKGHVLPPLSWLQLPPRQ